MKPRNLILFFIILAFSYNCCLANLTSEVTFSGSDFSFNTKGEFTLVSLPNSFHTTEVGAPQMPVTSLSFIIPQNVRVTGVRIISVEKNLMDGNFYLSPTQEEVPIGMTPSFAEPKKAIYESSSPYPGKIIELAGDGFLAGYHLAGVSIYPLEYIPKEGKLYLYSKIKFEIQYVDANRECVIPPLGLEQDYEKMILNSVKNPEDINLCRPTPILAKIVSPPADSIPYVIITNSEMLPAFQYLANWKIKKGTPTEIKNITSIQSESTGVDLAEKVRAYIKHMFQNHYTQWVLLGGDVSVIPSRNFYTYNWDNVLSDQYYMNLDGNFNLDGDTLYGEMEDSVDLFPEVYVGRVAAVNFSQAYAFVSKLWSYEKNSPNNDYQTRALFLSSCLWNDPEDQKLIDSVSRVVPGTFSKTSLFQYGRDMGISYLSTGYGLVMNYSHAQNSGNFLARYCDWIEQITKSNIDTLKNTDRYSVFLNVTCWNNKLEEDCLSKHFLLNPSGGGVGYIGSSSSDFPYTTRDLHVAFFDKLFNLGEMHIGKTLALAKLPYGRYSSWYVAYPNTWRYTYFSYSLLGDPQMEIWTDTPKDMEIDYPSSLPVGTDTFWVFAYEARDVGIPNALVCLRKQGEVYEIKKTGGPGGVRFIVTFPTSGAASLVVSKPGYRPKEVTITIGSPGCPMVSTWDGYQFVQDNVILTGSEDKDREQLMVNDFCPLSHSIEPQSNQYLLEISEFEKELSHLDYFGLLVADYDKNLQVGVTADGKVFSYRNPVSPISCVDQDGNDHLNEILYEDGVSFSSPSPGSLIINFGKLMGREVGKLSSILTTGGGPGIPPPPKNVPKLATSMIAQGKPNILHVDVQTPAGSWQKVGKFYPRTNSITALIDLSRYVVPGKDFIMRLRWDRYFSVDRLAYYTFYSNDIELHKLLLSSAQHSVQGDITNLVADIDNNEVSLSPGERIRLTFPALTQVNDLKRRKFILFAKGYYETQGGLSGDQQTLMSAGENIMLLQNYPNPFNPQTEIRYALKHECHVKLAIYNILGQTVRVLIDGLESPGIKRVNWDGCDESGNEVANGVYFYRLQVGQQNEVKKMLLLK